MASAAVSSGAGMQVARAGLASEGQARRWLASANLVGASARLVGRPHVSNDGHIWIGDSFSLGSRPTPSHLVAINGGQLVIGDRVTISYGAAIAAMCKVTIGDDTVIGPFVVIMDGDFHSVDDRDALGEMTPVQIGRGVIIGARVTVLRGSVIGDGARLESGCVVSGEVPAGAVVAGVPARNVVDQHRDGDPLAVPELVRSVLGLGFTPQLGDGPGTIPQWDSLGSLRLLLAVEDSYGVSLGEQDMKQVYSVGRLADLIAASVSRRLRA